MKIDSRRSHDNSLKLISVTCLVRFLQYNNNYTVISEFFIKYLAFQFQIQIYTINQTLQYSFYQLKKTNYVNIDFILDTAYSFKIIINTIFSYEFVSNLRHVGGFLQVLRFPPPIKLTATM